MTRSTWIAALLIVSIAGRTVADHSARMTEAATRIRNEFDRLDANGDRQIVRGEFLRLDGDHLVLTRDFRLYDFDSNGRLSRSEFACVSGLVVPALRGTMPDPCIDLLDDAVVALDQSYDRWDQRPKELVSAHTFVGNFLDSITPGGKRFVTGRIIDQADRDTDGRINRSEAKLFLEQQLGLRLHHGPPLRDPTGRLVRYDRFLAMDEDRDGRISRQEFVIGWWGFGKASEAFARMDGDRNGSVTYQEFAASDLETYFDPIEWFRDADTNLDASLSRDELMRAVDPSRQHLIETSLQSFDDDHDGQHSLREYRLSILAHYNYPWHDRPTDRNRDGSISYDEFVFDDVDLFQLQRWFFFHRIDLDGDGGLSTNEFKFQTQAPLAIRAYETSGNDSRLVYRNRDFPHCGWPTVSPDGSLILFHQAPATGLAGGTIVVASFDGDVVRTLCTGIRPTWSPDAKQFACERLSPVAGIWIMDAGGLRGQRVSSGHSPKWSSDGKSIAFIDDNGVSIYEIASGEIRQVLLREDHPYQDLGNDVVWSPDSRRLALLGNFAASSQLLILAIDVGAATDVRIRYSFDESIRGNLNWTNQEGIILAATVPRFEQARLLSITPDSKRGPTEVERFGGISVCSSACRTPDGKWYIAVAEE